MSRLSEATFDGGDGLNDLEIWGATTIKTLSSAIIRLSEQKDEDNSAEINGIAYEIMEKCELMEQVIERFIDEARAAAAK